MLSLKLSLSSLFRIIELIILINIYMEKESVESKLTTNHAAILFGMHQENILHVRQSLFKDLNQKSPLLGKAVKRILETKIEKALQAPLMFELLPWIIGDFSNINRKETEKLAVNWLAVYLYVTYIDDHLDEKKPLIADEILGASVSAQKGLLNLFKIVQGSKYEKIFNDSLFSSASFELVDIIEQSNSENIDSKTISSGGKNHILFICAAAFAASDRENGDFIIKLTRKLLLAIQYLDDLADFENDWYTKNYTVLLSGMNVNSKMGDRIELLNAIVTNGSLYRVLMEIEQALDSIQILLIKKRVIIGKKNASIMFFSAINLEITKLRIYLEEKVDDFTSIEDSERLKIIDEIDKSIYRIYFHT